jgi:hypothetical protein
MSLHPIYILAILTILTIVNIIISSTPLARIVGNGGSDALWQQREQFYQQRGIITQRPDDWYKTVRWYITIYSVNISISILVLGWMLWYWINWEF